MVRAFEVGTRAAVVGTRALQKTLSTTTWVDNFDDESLSEYSLSTANAWTTTTTSPIQGTASLLRDGSAESGYETLISTSGLDNYVSKGTTFQAKITHPADSSSGSNSQLGPLFGVGDHDNWYCARYDAVEDDLKILVEDAGTRSTIASDLTATGGSYTAGDVLVIEVTWDDGTLGGSDNDITAKLYNSDKTTEHASIAATNSTHATNTGVGVHGWSDGTHEPKLDAYEIL